MFLTTEFKGDVRRHLNGYLVYSAVHFGSGPAPWTRQGGTFLTRDLRRIEALRLGLPPDSDTWKEDGGEALLKHERDAEAWGDPENPKLMVEYLQAVCPNAAVLSMTQATSVGIGVLNEIYAGKPICVVSTNGVVTIKHGESLMYTVTTDRHRRRVIPPDFDGSIFMTPKPRRGTQTTTTESFEDGRPGTGDTIAPVTKAGAKIFEVADAVDVWSGTDGIREIEGRPVEAQTFLRALNKKKGAGSDRSVNLYTAEFSYLVNKLLEWNGKGETEIHRFDPEEARRWCEGWISASECVVGLFG